MGGESQMRNITIEKGPKTVDLRSPEDKTDDELEGLKNKVIKAEQSLQETRYRFLRNGIITFEDCEKLAEKLSGNGIYYLASDISEKFMAGEISIDEFFPQDAKETDADAVDIEEEDITTLDECSRYRDDEHIPGT
jgi:hypothetical protein